MKLCDHGCGQTAIHTTKGSLASGPFNGAPVQQCAKSANSCPAVKQRKIDASRAKFGTDYPWQTKKISDKRSATNLKKYGHKSSIMNPEIQAKRKTTMLERYGVEETALNPALNKKRGDAIKQAIADDPNIMKRVIATRRKKYGNNLEKVIAKTRKTRQANGDWVKDEDRSAWQKYKKSVGYYTARNYKKYKDIINPNNLPFSRDNSGHQLDHNYSRHAGFENNIPPKVIGHQANLRIIRAKENKVKNSKCDITIENLMEMIQK